MPRRIAPLSADARIAEIPNQIGKCLPIAHKWNPFTRFFWSENRFELGQHCVRQSCILMMHAVIGFVQQSVSKHTAKPAFRHDAASRAVHSVTGKPDMLDVFAPVLEICRNQRRNQIQPKKIFPNAPKSDGSDNGRPHRDCQGQLRPNSSSYLSTSD